jgi:hypothetical protein
MHGTTIETVSKLFFMAITEEQLALSMQNLVRRCIINILTHYVNTNMAKVRNFR